VKIGLSLGSGGSRGYAHLGVLKAFEEAGINVEIINGSSIGAIIGGAYALYYDTATIIKITEALLETIDIKYFNIFHYAKGSRAFLQDWLIHAACDISTLRTSIYSSKRNRKALQFIFGERSFSETKVPFSAVAIDLLSGEVVRIKEGALVEGILPSISIPGIFPPVEHEGRLLVDGGVLAEVPVRELRQEGAEFVIAVRLKGNDSAPDWESGFKLLTYIESLKGEALKNWELDAADFTLEIDLQDMDSLRFDSYEPAIAEGYAVAKQGLPDLLKRLEEHK
jgi:NTE family protein